MRLTRGMRLTTAALTCFRVLFCDGFAGDHTLTHIRMTFPRNAFNDCGVDGFLSFVLRWLCLFVWSLVCLCVLFFFLCYFFSFFVFWWSMFQYMSNSWRIFYQKSSILRKYNEKGCQIYARRPLTFGRGFVRPSFCPTKWPNKRCQTCAGSPMVFGRVVFDLVFAQPIGLRNNHLNENLPTRNY